MFQLDYQQKINHKNPSDLPSAKYKTLENYRVYGTSYHLNKTWIVQCDSTYIAKNLLVIIIRVRSYVYQTKLVALLDNLTVLLR